MDHLPVAAFHKTRPATQSEIVACGLDVKWKLAHGYKLRVTIGDDEHPLLWLVEDDD